MAQAEGDRVSLRLQAAVYICGIFSSGTSNLVWVIVPLWLVKLEASPIMIGISLGAYTFLPLLLSIPGGALIDRLGARRVIITFGLAVVCLIPLYPLLPWLPALIILQMLTGLAISMGWISTQTLVGQRMKGNPTYAGRLAFVVRMGTLIGPPTVGAIWDLFGEWGAFGFMALWTSGVLVAVAILPKSDQELSTGHAPFRASEFRPSFQNYRDALAMLATPSILLVVLVSVLRQSGQGIQSSFYIVYLENIGLTGTAIGLLLSSFLVASAFGALTTGPLMRIFNPFWLLIATVALSTVFIAITPLLGLYFLLMAAITLRGAVLGMVQPLMLTIISQAAGPGDQGKGVALRATANRLAMTVIPVIMGGVIELVGMRNAFLVIGAVLLLLVLALALYVKRTPAYRS
ncbi:MAG: MFS transporter [Alphaproteobacteria bacterium]|nr:MFS transporter [Alphaproteobacteria bacterium]MCZ6885060.1 MFS transporter [Alphaproteobacteria bacterium]